MNCWQAAAYGSIPLLWAAGAAGASAQERPVTLDTVVVEVNSRAAPALGTATRAVDVVDAAMIRASPARTTVDALQWAFGVDFMPRSPALVDVGIRGSSFEQVLVLVDGVRLRDGQTGHFNLNLAVPLDQVERIEVLRGPASALYGSDAMAGVINVVTRKGAQGTSAGFSRGSFESTGAAVSHAQRVGPIRTDVAGSYDRSEGHRPGADYEMSLGRAAIEVPGGPLPTWIELAHARRDFGADGFYGAFPAFESTRTTTGVARSLLPLGRGSLEPLLRFRRNTDDFILYRDDPTRYRNDHATTQLGAEVIGRFAASEWLRFAAGLHAYEDRIRSTALGRHSESTTAASFEIAAGGPASSTGTLGIRLDRISGGSLSASPGASVAWWPTGRVRLRSSAGRAFRAPTWTERFYEDPVHVGDPGLMPERAWSVEVGADAFPLPGLRLGTAGYVRRATDLIDWARPFGEPSARWVSRNVEKAEFRGAEAEIELEDLLGIRVRGRGTWLTPSSEAAAGFESKYALRPLAESVSLALERHLGRHRAGLSAARERRVGEASHLRVDGRAAIAAGPLEVRLDLRNAFHAHYLDISGIPAAGRSVAIGAEWRSHRPASR
jgi:outer membrane cobalamin receptor